MTLLDYQTPQTTRKQRAVPVRWLGWAIFLGMSWTWCIGMFLPVLFVRDYGPWAWVAFAIPNVVGAAAMGWLLSSGTSEHITTKHRLAVSAFSWVTSAFQLFFVFWVFDSVGTPQLRTVACLFAAVSLIAAMISMRLAIGAAIVALLVSSYAIVYGESYALDQLGTLLEATPSRDVMLLTPVIGFGFLLCPYLDSTFHAVRQQTSDLTSRIAFSVGFGGFFFLMIFYSLAYVPFARIALGSRIEPIKLVALHWSVQLGLTAAFHWQFGSSKKRVSWDANWVRIGGTLLLGFGSWLLSSLFGDRQTVGGETVYLMFMAFYGLVFPAYVWLCMIPGRGRSAPDRKQIVILCVSILIAAPMYWMGFIERRMIWLLPGLGVVLLARLLIPRKLPGESITAAVL